ncbi:MAG: WYL domain-containing protein [Proteobacteria bacterium]|nr:WYL domain-containing protein [Desulfobulbaceae bacterium]MBU4151612.1 WYL domain-containing protein [Pseudomonadota bacterium]
MGDQLFLERFVWFDNEIRKQHYPNASNLAEQFEITIKTGQRCIEYFRDRLLVPLEYDFFKKGYRYTDPSFQLPVTRISEEELLALLISQKLITEASAGSLGDELGRVSKRLGSLLAANLPGRAHPEDAFSFRWKNINPTDPRIFKVVTSALLQGRLLTFNYHSPSAVHDVVRTVEPHHMVNYMGNWHLIAFCHLRVEWRDFLLGRMTNCAMENREFTIREREEWQPFLQNTFGIYQNRSSFDVVLRFTPERSRWVKEEVWHERQIEEVQADGSLIRTIPVSHEVEIMMEVLKHGSQVEVLKPQWLRDKVIEEMRAAVTNYLYADSARGGMMPAQVDQH